MSNFAGLDGALTSLQAQRRMLEVARQNIANVDTPGYTRQRTDLVSIESATMKSRYTKERVAEAVDAGDLEDPGALVDAVATGYRTVAGEWSDVRTKVAALDMRVNELADTDADLNQRIRSNAVSGGNPNTLIDQRAQAVAELADPAGGTGAFATAAARYNELATELATRVNEAHATGVHLDHDPSAPDVATDVFTLGGNPPALNLEVTLTDPRTVRAASPGLGRFDGSVAGACPTSVPGWALRGARASSTSACEPAPRSSAESVLQSQAGVNVDEETLTLVAGQRAYEAAARVISTLDEMLDTLINRTGIVGR